MIDFLRSIIGFFEKHHIDYMLSGSVAMSLYTEPRFTRDYDFIVHLKTENVNALLEYFKEGYYCEEESVKDAIKRKGMFNIIDHKSGYKADFVILKTDRFRQEEFGRRRKIPFLEMQLFVVSAEDLLISKLCWIQEIQSGIQMNDIQAIWQIHDLDKKYISQWIKELNLNSFNLLS